MKYTNRPMALYGLLLAALPCCALSIAHAQDAPPAAPAVPAAPATQDTKADAPVTWTVKYKKNETRKYQNKATITGNAGGMPITAVVNTTEQSMVAQVTDAGDVTISRTVLTQKITINDMELEQPIDKDPALRTVNKNGQVVKRSAGTEDKGGDAIIRLGVLLGSVPYSEKPVKIGDSWTTEYSSEATLGRKISMTYTLVGRERMLGRDTLKIKAAGKVAVNSDAKDLSDVSATMYLDPENGDVVSVTSKGDNIEYPTPGGPIKIAIETMTTEIIPGVNDKTEKTDKTDKTEPKK